MRLVLLSDEGVLLDQTDLTMEDFEQDAQAHPNSILAGLSPGSGE